MRRNISALYLIQVTNFGLPLITLPYLAHILGPSGLGRIGFAQALAQIMLIFVDFGFDLTSTRKAILCGRDKQALSRIYWTTISAKAFFALVASVLIGFFAIFSRGDENEMGVVLCATLIFWGSVITPSWLFQGTQKIYVLALCTVIVRMLSLVVLFLYVKTEKNLILAAMLQFSPGVVSGLLLTGLLFLRRSIAWGGKFSVLDIFQDIKDSSHLFLSSALTSVYMYANVIFLNLICGSVISGYYVAAEKITNPMRQLITPPVQAFFPKICALYADGKSSEAGFIINRFMILFLLGGGLGFVFFEIFGPYFVIKLLGLKYLPAISVLRVLIVVPAILGIATVLVQFGIIAAGNQVVLKRVYLIGAIFHLIQTPVVIYFFGAIGAACSVVLTELAMTSLLFRAVRKRRLIEIVF